MLGIEPVSSDPSFSWRDYGEAVVKRITAYDLYEIFVREPAEEDFSSPNVYTRGKAEMNQGAAEITGFASKYLVIGAIAIVALVLLHAYLMGGRR